MYYCTFLLILLGANPFSVIGMYKRIPPLNDWHYVTITYDSKTLTYTWENRASRKWSLYPTDKDDELRVGEDCPYYSDGYKIARITEEGIFGAHDLYIKNNQM